MSEKKSIAQPEAGRVVQSSRAPCMLLIRYDIIEHGYSDLKEAEELTPEQVADLQMYGLHQIPGTRRIARK